MNSVLIILDSLNQWAPYYQTESAITAIDYLKNDELSHTSYLVINLCSDLSYHSEGYYCSLLAQARRHRTIPGIDAINQLDQSSLCRLDNGLAKLCRRWLTPEGPSDSGLVAQFDIFFGRCQDERLSRVARFIFEHYPFPLLRALIDLSTTSCLASITALSLDGLNDSEQTFFAESLDQFSTKVWRQPRGRKQSRYDLAILHDPEESFPPSNKTALHTFLTEAKKMNINAELITEEDSARLMEFDALFIRQTTAVNHITYQLAKRAQQADVVVIDDPASIVRCTNKVFLKELLDREMIPAPKSKLLFRSRPCSWPDLTAYLGDTMVIKIPDGSFSVGVSRISNPDEYARVLDELFQRSSILLAQEFVASEFDWRIGVLAGECIFACKYFMAKGHWQIYHHKSAGHTRSGRVETIPVHQAPKQVIRLALRVSQAIGRGLYGVDIKSVDGKPMIIEVNDNPSIDHGIEDIVLGNELYRMILREFLTRLNKKHRSS
ncbi:MAG: RimK family protein [Desulfobulbaceae bacterium]|jgi:glutathione synthase/RimK-type ligase-like ATP-grasp enzyme|nr:RimK family protein [Desulfobulbaceae bacterium]